MNTIAVIPARGGSKRIHRKNLRDFAGRPVIAWSVACARESGLFDRIVVSTEDEEIAAVAQSEGAEVPFLRPLDLADDHSTTAEVMAHAANALSAPGGSALCCIYATAPLLTPARLSEAQDRFVAADVDYVFAAARFAFPPQRGLVVDKSDGLRPFDPTSTGFRSQDLAPVFHDAGQFYWGAAEAWREQRPIFGSRSAMIVLPPWEVCDIDDEVDWAYAERLFALNRNAEQDFKRTQ